MHWWMRTTHTHTHTHTYIYIYIYTHTDTQGGSNMTGTDLCVNKPHQSQSYLNHLVYIYIYIYIYTRTHTKRACTNTHCYVHVSSPTLSLANDIVRLGGHHLEVRKM